ncbi:snRNA-activating protein complex subunit 2 [Brienomyrus brachyistius]|uniref:snRNA-activating protein complex subunit 2 n=1 Tax=Brienomyrus brachyistius TaxID=42636 RepID=UPI0020B1CADF|nr:snRNA-activating protein complex subunit 2 [Brienomyrus brachyistius]XP_048885371.1 snRNA-activating protein complex subunit 2 [Brienomyrus brachyistius]XP_048885372.1 snRNA-activating protein complex subunit 2 [Brienomyrus brachyistius]XP_048885373.1 snRNA-activating protein complex subunit 2 [Brienomyrus brachyistius]
MKPPSRRRELPQRFTRQQPERLKVRGDWCGWSRAERRRLMVELRKQSCKPELDINILKEKLPKRSAIEITSFLQKLKSRVGKMVATYVQRQLRQERLARVPAQLWEKLAQDMTGSMEEAISSAFSQMLVIGATEPCSLLHSLPPCSLDSSVSSSSGLRTISRKSLSRSASPKAVSPSLESPAQGKPCSSSTNQQPEPAQQTFLSRLSKSEHTVNFENIYRFLNALSKKVKEPTLTAMESGVVLDLLLSLPEELPLLDCQELQHHLCQIHARLNATAEEPHPCSRLGSNPISPSVVHMAASERDVQTEDNSTNKQHGQTDVSKSSDILVSELVGDGASCSNGDEDAGLSSKNSLDETNQKDGGKDRAAKGSLGPQRDSLANAGTMTMQVQTEANQSTPTSPPSPRTDKANWATVGLCPMNPFMIPLKLLAQSATPHMEDVP